ncbi:MAG: hypothetical protein IIY78_09105 [Clostridia bacterium]|nr:hypothetical protein [Clostridia bacterium]
MPRKVFYRKSIDTIDIDRLLVKLYRREKRNHIFVGKAACSTQAAFS